jgi:hypothetical protein
VEEKTHTKITHIANANAYKESSNVVEEETHKNNITPKMSLYDWSLLIILITIAIYN